MNKIIDCELHDSFLKEIIFNSIKDFNDEIKIILESEFFKDVFKTNKIVILIKDCYKLKFNINMWISGYDTIREYKLLSNSDWIVEENNKSNVPKELKHFILEFNTSGSILNFLLTKDLIILPIFEK